MLLSIRNSPKLKLTKTMASLVWLLCMFLFMNTAADEFADPNITKTYCLNFKQPLLFEDPFPTSVQGERFVQMNWLYRPFDKTGVKQPEKVLFSLKIPKLEAVVKDPRFEKYQNWGLSLENPKPEDAGVYRAVLALMGSYRNDINTTNVIMSLPPTLNTSRLAVSRSSNNQTGEITLKCGTVASLGTPPVKLIWRNPNGTAIDAVYKDGNITLVLGSEEGAGTYTCQVTKQSLAFQCVHPADVSFWEGKFNFDGDTMHLPEFADPNITKTYCLNSKKPLLFEDPFPTRVQGKRFAQMNWHYRPFHKAGVKQPEKVLFSLKIPKLEAVVKDPRFKKYQHWGLSLENPKPEDAGIYRAILALMGSYKNEIQTTNVIMSLPPTLSTSRLAVSRSSDNQTGEITLKCGTIASLGTPPVQLIWRNPNGTAIDAMYKDGNITLVLGSEEGTGTYTCQVTKQSLAFQCVPPADVPLWKGKFNFDEETIYFSESNIMMIVIIMCVIVAIVLAIIGIMMLRKKGQKNTFRFTRTNGKSGLDDKEAPVKTAEAVAWGIGSEVDGDWLEYGESSV